MKENKYVNLYRLEGTDEFLILNMINYDPELRKTFGGEENTKSRIRCSEFSALIRDKETTVGFVMILRSNHTNKYEVDLGILEQYRKKGYATKAMELLKNVILYNDLNIEIQTKKDNVGANKSVIKNGFTLCREDKFCNYYILKEDSKNIR